MNQSQLATTESQLSPAVIQDVLINQDLSGLNDQERLSYYQSICQSLGLNPLTRPFAYITLNEKLTLYALKDCTEQLRKVHSISLTIATREVIEGVYVVTARATNKEGRTDESIGAVPLSKEGGEWQRPEGRKPFFKKNGTIIPIQGEDRANAMMKAETKAKRRVTLSICGLGMLDETEVGSIQGAVIYDDPARLAVEASINNRRDDVQDIRNDVANTIKESAVKDWENIRCPIGKAGGPVNDKTAGELCGPSASTKKAQSILEWWHNTGLPHIDQLISGNVATKDHHAFKAAMECAENAFKSRPDPVSAPDTPKDDKNADNANLAQPSASNEAKPEPTLEVVAEVTSKPAPEKSAKKAKPETLDWRNVTVPFECALKGQKLSGLVDNSGQGFTWLQLFHAIKKQLIDNPAKFKTIPVKDGNKFKAAYEIAAVEMCLGRSPQEVNNKIRDLCSDMVISNETQVAHAEALGIIPKLGAKTWEKHEPESIQNVIRMWPDFAQSVQDNFDKEGK